MKHVYLAVILAACGGGASGTTLFDGPTSGNVAVADGTVYFTTYGNAGNHLLAVPLAGGEAVEVSPDPAPAAAFPGNLMIVDDRAWWSATGTVIAADLDTGEREIVAELPPASSLGANLAVDDQFVYAAGIDLLKIPRAGGAITTLLEGNSATSITVADGELLFIEGGLVVALDIETATRRELDTGSPFLFSVVYDAATDTALAINERELFRFELATGQPLETLSLETGEAYIGMLVDRGQIYGWRSVEHQPLCDLVRISTTTGDVEQLATGGCGQLALDGNTLVAAGVETSAKDGAIVRFDLD